MKYDYNFIMSLHTMNFKCLIFTVYYKLSAALPVSDHLGLGMKVKHNSMTYLVNLIKCSAFDMLEIWKVLLSFLKRSYELSSFQSV